MYRKNYSKDLRYLSKPTSWAGQGKQSLRYSVKD